MRDVEVRRAHAAHHADVVHRARRGSSRSAPTRPRQRASRDFRRRVRLDVLDERQVGRHVDDTPRRRADRDRRARRCCRARPARDRAATNETARPVRVDPVALRAVVLRPELAHVDVVPLAREEDRARRAHGHLFLEVRVVPPEVEDAIAPLDEGTALRRGRALAPQVHAPRHRHRLDVRLEAEVVARVPRESRPVSRVAEALVPVRVADALVVVDLLRRTSSRGVDRVVDRAVCCLAALVGLPQREALHAEGWRRRRGRNASAQALAVRDHRGQRSRRAVHLRAELGERRHVVRLAELVPQGDERVGANDTALACA